MGDNAVRDAGFGERFASACDANPNCPPLQSGRYVWIAEQFQKRFEVKISGESIRRWQYGESRPRQDNIFRLAEILSADANWLGMGTGMAAGSTAERRAHRAYAAEADGAIDLVAGLIRMDGGQIAFPEETDKRAKRQHIHLYAIIKGANYSVSVVRGTDNPSRGGFQFDVPLSACSDEVVVLGVLREGFNFRVIEIGDDLQATGTTKTPIMEVVVPSPMVGQYEILDFKSRL